MPSYTTELSFDLSPVRLSYAAALRNVKPKKPQEPFIYAQIGAFTPLNFMAMAASNPQGTFYALINDSSLLQKAKDVAKQRNLTNVNFILSLDELPTGIDYICFENLNAEPTEDDEIFSLIEKHLKEGGLLCYRYKAYNNQDECLRFLVEEYAPELSDQDALDFLTEIRTLGRTYFQHNLIAQNALANAIDNKDPSSFFTTCIPNDDSSITSGTFEVLKTLLQRNFAFVGSADIASNYLQLSAPAETHEELEKCKDQLFYEIIKDFTVNQSVRNDIWVRMPVEQTDDKTELFGHFTFGITTPRDLIPDTLSMKGADISLQTPLFTRLIDLMCTLPMCVGDFLQHPSGQGMDPVEVLAAIHVLVACGIAQPMRTHYEGKVNADVENPAWSITYNEHLTHTPITEPVIQIASPIVGSPLSLPARDALVLQAIQRVGVTNSAGILQIELKNLIEKNPALAAKILDTAEPTDEAVHDILTVTLTQNMLRWYAYGLLAA